MSKDSHIVLTRTCAEVDDFQRWNVAGFASSQDEADEMVSRLAPSLRSGDLVATGPMEICNPAILPHRAYLFVIVGSRSVSASLSPRGLTWLEMWESEHSDPLDMVSASWCLDKRRLDFLAARLAEEHVVAASHEIFSDVVQTINSEAGRPVDSLASSQEKHARLLDLASSSSGNARSARFAICSAFSFFSGLNNRKIVYIGDIQQNFLDLQDTTRLTVGAVGIDRTLEIVRLCIPLHVFLLNRFGATLTSDV